jgi:Lipase (class 3)
MPPSEPKDIEKEAESQMARVNDFASTTDPRLGSTLLPGPIAAVISTTTGVASLGVQVGTRVGAWTIYGFRESTLKSLSVSRSIAEHVLVLAGRDVAARSGGELGRQEAASILQKSISILHAGISTTSFIASTGFHLGEACLQSVSGSTIHLLSMLNSICGSTESSKAVASVISLLTNELNKPEGGEIITYWDIVVAVIGFVMLQRWGRRQTQIDFRAAGGEETIWDTVIDDRGWRADVVGTRRKALITLNNSAAVNRVSFSGLDEEDNFEVLERGTLFDAQQMELAPSTQIMPSDEDIRERILNQLPQGAHAIITSELTAVKTIKVELYGTDAAHIEPPPGTIMVAERLDHSSAMNGDRPSQTVVFRAKVNGSHTAEIEPIDPSRLILSDEKCADDDHEGVFMAVPSKSTASSSTVEPKSGDLKNDSDREVQETPFKFPTTTANQKKSRKPMFSNISPPDFKTSRIPQVKLTKEKHQSTKHSKDGVIKKALRTLSPSSSVVTMKETPVKRREIKPLPQLPPLTPMRDLSPPRLHPLSTLSNGHTPRTSPIIVASPQQATSESYFTIHETRHDSTMSQTETYSVHSVDSRPGSPTFSRTHTRTVNGISHTKSEIALSVKGSEVHSESPTHHHHHHRSRSFVPSLYSMGSKHSGEAVILAAKRPPVPRKSIYEDDKMLELLTEQGKVPGIFPDQHMVRTVRRFARFATAVYGDNFLRFMGLKESNENLSKSSELVELDIPHEHNSFSNYIGLPADTILMSTFRDPHGIVANNGWSTSTMGLLFHFISIDHDSKAIVLTCRGTLGFEDVLTDMTCDYDDIYWQGQRYQVHKGIHASARRLLWGSSTRVMLTLQRALNEHKDYGVVLCGHSLGGAVAAVVAILISEPAPGNSSSQKFVTGTPPKLLPSTTTPSTYLPTSADNFPITPVPLPPGRPIHVYAYGPPATFSEPLRLATRGLITTVVNAGDIVPCLSLGTLHDFRTAAVHLKHDTSDAMTQVKARVWSRITSTFSLTTPAPSSATPGLLVPEHIAGSGVGEDTWSWQTLRTLRAAMKNPKLVPPGEVFIVETTQVYDRLSADVKQEARYGYGAEGQTKDDRTERLYEALGRPATRVQFKLVRDVETRFGELRFGRDMFTDHSPGRYESKLGALEAGVCED